VLSYEALADDVSADTIIARVLSAVPVPEVALTGHPRELAGRPHQARGR
jgi:hypothetical protein